jgi:hypothetical protein
MNYKEFELSLDAYALLPQWLTDGRWVNNAEYRCADIHGGDGASMSVKKVGDTWMWRDFASAGAQDNGVGLIALYARIKYLPWRVALSELKRQSILGQDSSSDKDLVNVSVDTETRHLALATAASAVPREESQNFGTRCAADTSATHIAKPSKNPAKPSGPCPEMHDAFTCRHPEFGSAVKVWDYHDSEGNLWAKVARYETVNGKEIIPWYWNTEEEWWRRGQYRARDRFLYRLHELTDKHTHVLLVAGEKCADAANKMLCSAASLYRDNVFVTTWVGGEGTWMQTNFSPLQGRKICLWPDADEKGVTAMAALAQHLLAKVEPVFVKTVDVSAFPKKCDIADLIDGEELSLDGKKLGRNVEPWTFARVVAFIKTATLIKPRPEEGTREASVREIALIRRALKQLHPERITRQSVTNIVAALRKLRLHSEAQDWYPDFPLYWSDGCDQDPLAAIVAEYRKHAGR